MPTLMADHDVIGHLRVIMNVLLSPDWIEHWTEVQCGIESFERLGLPDNASDTEVWQTCQQRQIVLITGNRNAEGEDSLEMTIRQYRTPQSLPVFTISDPNRIMLGRDYAERVAARLIEYLTDLNRLAGSGRLFLP
jgi:Domain of unknown function (DUF5615)